MRRKEKNRERDKYLTSDDIPWWVGGPKKIRRSRKLKETLINGPAVI